jgi:hypothetical protein
MRLMKKSEESEKNQNNMIEQLILLGRSELKYIDSNGIEYCVNIEMIVNDEYDFVLFPDSLQFYEDYFKKHNSNNVIYTETYDKNKRTCYRTLKYINEFDSNIPKERQENIIQRIIELAVKYKNNNT